MPFVPLQNQNRKQSQLGATPGFRPLNQSPTLLFRGASGVVNPAAEATLKKQEKQIENAAKEDLLKNTVILQDAPVTSTLENIQAINEAELILKDIENAKKGTPTGPGYSYLFNAALKNIDPQTNTEKQPGWTNTVIQSIAPERTKKIRELDQALNRLFDYLTTKGGKQLTGTEKGSILAQFPGLYDKEDTFNSTLQKAKVNLKELKKSKVDFLKNIGLDEKTLNKITNVNQVLDTQQPQQGGNDLQKLSTEELLKML